MPDILISALMTDGSSVLFEVTGPAVEGPVPLLGLPRYVLGQQDDSIEDALTAGVLADFGVEVVAQEFVDTVYERTPGSSEVRLNNLQLVTAWEGEVPLQTAADRDLIWVPLDALAALDLNEDLRQAVLGAFGIEAEPRMAVAAQPGRVVVITGPAGSGKSTVAGIIAATLSRCAVVHLDELWHMVVSGSPTPHWEGGDFEASYRFGLLAYRNGAALARNFSEAGFDAIVEGIVEQPRELDLFLAGLGGADAYLVRLMPSLEELVRRDQARPEQQRMGERSREHLEIFSTNGEFRGMRLDSSDLSAEETAALVLEQLVDAQVQ